MYKMLPRKQLGIRMGLYINVSIKCYYKTCSGQSNKYEIKS